LARPPQKKRERGSREEKEGEKAIIAKHVGESSPAKEDLLRRGSAMRTRKDEGEKKKRGKG